MCREKERREKRRKGEKRREKGRVENVSPPLLNDSHYLLHKPHSRKACKEEKCVEGEEDNVEKKRVMWKMVAQKEKGDARKK